MYVLHVHHGFQQISSDIWLHDMKSVLFKNVVFQLTWVMGVITSQQSHVNTNITKDNKERHIIFPLAW